jgi:hypothetical protein
MKFPVLVFGFFLLFFCIPGSSAQQGKRQDRQNSGQQGEPYLIPQTVFVGDKASLVVPLGLVSDRDGVRELPPYSIASGIPEEKAVLVIHKMRLEIRGGAGQLFIDFTAYAPGLLHLPPIVIPSRTLNDLHVEISSILEEGNEGKVLSDPAPPLAVPGTSFLIYGTIAALLILLLLILGGGLWSRTYFKGWLDRWKRRRLIASIASLERRLRRNLQKGKSQDYGELLTFLSGELRTFLGLFTGLNCRAMTAGELTMLPPLEVTGRNDSALLGGEYLGRLFRRWDNLRYSGTVIDKENIFAVLDELKQFTETLDRVLRYPAKPAYGPASVESAAGPAAAHAEGRSA